jgi:hypothetical protein
MSRGNRQVRAFNVMVKIAKRMSRQLGQNIDAFEIDSLLEIRGNYQDEVGKVDDLIRRFDLVSIIA